jgi:hypothetical protein
MPLRTATSFVTSARMLVAVGRGARLGQLRSSAATCSNVTFTGAASSPSAITCAAAGPGGGGGGGGGGCARGSGASPCAGGCAGGGGAGGAPGGAAGGAATLMVVPVPLRVIFFLDRNC